MAGFPETIDRTSTVPAALIASYAALAAFTTTPLAAAALIAPLLAFAVVWWTISGPQRWIALFFACALLLPPLPVALGNSGPHPALAVAALGLLAGFLRLREWQIKADLLTTVLVLFFCFLLASVALAALYSGLAIAAASLARVLLFGISVYIFFYTAYGPQSNRGEPVRAARLLFAAAIAAALFACVDFYYQFPAPAGYGPQFVWLDSGVFRRAQGLFYEASTLGNFCAFFLVMVAVGLFRTGAGQAFSRVWLRVWLLAGGVILAAAMIFSYSRASLINFAVSLCALAYVKRVRMKRVIAGLLACVAAGAICVYAIFPSFAMSYWIRLSASLQYLWSSPEGVLSGRVASWRTLTAFLIEHPWHGVFGIGYKTLPYSDVAGRTIIADNMYLSLLVETGVVGLLVFLLLNFAILRSGLSAARSRSQAAVFFGAWVFCFWTGQLAQMFSGDLMTYWRVLPLYFWALAVAVRECRKSAAT
jgi:hypothetical protein